MSYDKSNTNHTRQHERFRRITTLNCKKCTY